MASDEPGRARDEVRHARSLLAGDAAVQRYQPPRQSTLAARRLAASILRVLALLQPPLDQR